MALGQGPANMGRDEGAAALEKTSVFLTDDRLIPIQVHRPIYIHEY